MKCQIFGSEPPNFDSFWKNYGTVSGAEVFTFNRSEITGAEKQVDTKIVTEVVSAAHNYGGSTMCKCLMIIYPLL